MATYKVIQDVEAEDKILGPLSLKQLIYAAIAAGLAFGAFRLVQVTGSIYLAIPFIPFLIVFGALAAPISRDQSTEMWLAAMLRFYTKPRKRIWDQDGMKELVHVTVPKREEKHYTDGLNQTQVRSRLNALATTLDSRGWAVKNAQYSAVPKYGAQATDRIIDTSSLPQLAPAVSDSDALDVMDVNTSQVAQHFDEMMKQEGQSNRQAAIAKMKQPAQSQDDNQSQQEQNDYWFMHESEPAKPLSKGETMFNETVVHPGATTDDPTAAQAQTVDDSNLTEEEKAAIEFAKEKQKADEFSNYNHHKVVLTPAQLEEQAKELAKKQRQEAEAKRQEEERKRAETRLSKTDTIELAKADNLKVSTVAGLAKHKTKKKDETDEVVINLH